jgi:hypothetical protein
MTMAKRAKLFPASPATDGDLDIHQRSQGQRNPHPTNSGPSSALVTTSANNGSMTPPQAAFGNRGPPSLARPCKQSGVAASPPHTGCLVTPTMSSEKVFSAASQVCHAHGRRTTDEEGSTFMPVASNSNARPNELLAALASQQPRTAPEPQGSTGNADDKDVTDVHGEDCPAC